MKIIIAPDSFKGSLSSVKAADCMAIGVFRVFLDAEIVKIPIADGGEGTVEAMLAASGGRRCYARVNGPFGETVDAKFGILTDGRAVIEMAEASGLMRVPENQRNPMSACTYGTGQLIRAALNEGCVSIIIGLGGSATNDGGKGMANALGMSFLDENGNELLPGGGCLNKLRRIDKSGIDKRIANTEIIIASDVNNPLCGDNGASYVFGMQKGATREMVKKLDSNLRHFAEVTKELTLIDYSDTPCAGAAGGLGFGLMAFCGAKQRSGIDIVLESAGIDKHLKDTDLIITGEGKIDAQTVMGKAPIGIAERAKRYGVPVIAITGSIGDGIEEIYNRGIDSVMCCLSSCVTISEAVAEAERNLVDATERAMRFLKTGMKMRR